MKRLSSAIALCTVGTLVLSPAVASAAAQKLLIREVVASPTQAESIAIKNIGASAVDLTHYYLADYETYYNLALMAPPAAPSSDFLVQFPAGSMIQPGETQYISVGGATCFKNACGVVGTFVGFGVSPNYEILNAVAANSDPLVPDMLAPFAAAISANHGLTNGGEPVVLFYWDKGGNTPLVTDVDYVYYGTPSVSNPAVNKTGVIINGQTYLADTADAASHHAPVSVAPITIATCRVDFTEGTQLMSGGNGVNGSDETSENSASTWKACALPTLLDADLDGIANATDNCINIANPAQTDTDMDGVGDACDNCVNVSNANQVDADMDGVGDACDQCPNQAGPPNNNGCPLGSSSSAAASSSSGGMGGFGSAVASSTAGVGGAGGFASAVASSSAGVGGAGGFATSSVGVGGAGGFATSSVGVGGAGGFATSSVGVGGAGGLGSGGASSVAGSSGAGMGGASAGAGGSSSSSAASSSTTASSSSASGSSSASATSSASGGGMGGGGDNPGDTGSCGCTTVGSESSAELPFAPILAALGMALGLRRRRSR